MNMNLNPNADVRSSVKTTIAATLLMTMVLFLSGCSGPMINALQTIHTVSSLAKL